MTILSDDSQTTTQYNLATNTLSRAVDNKLHKIHLGDNNSIQRVHQIAQLDNEQFKVLAMTLKQTKHSLS